MWIHEGFTAYSENLYLDYHFGKEFASKYVIGTRANVKNDKPIIGLYDVNNRGSARYVLQRCQHAAYHKTTAGG